MEKDLEVLVLAPVASHLTAKRFSTLSAQSRDVLRPPNQISEFHNIQDSDCWIDVEIVKQMFITTRFDTL